MDMKRILQAFDNASTKPVEGASDMKKFLQVVTEGTNPHKVSLPVQMAMQHYQAPKEELVSVKKPSLLTKYLEEAEQKVQQEEADRKARLKMYAHTIAERVLMKESTRRK